MNFFGVFCVKNHDFTPKKNIFSNCGGRRENFWGISCEKSRFYDKKIKFFPIAEGGTKFVGVFRVKNHDFTPKNHIFSNFRGHAPPPWIRPCYVLFTKIYMINGVVILGTDRQTLFWASFYECFWFEQLCICSFSKWPPLW